MHNGNGVHGMSVCTAMSVCLYVHDMSLCTAMSVCLYVQGGEPVGDAVTESRSKEDVSEVTQYDGVWKQKNEQAMENEFQKDLRV